MDEAYSIYLNVKPQVLKRHRHKLIQGRVMTYDAQVKTKDFFRQLLLAELLEKYPLSLPFKEQMEFDMTFFFALPKSLSRARKSEFWGKPCNSYGDLDNYVKFVFDSLNKHLFKDDKQVVKIAARKQWAEDDGLLIRFSPVGEMLNLGKGKDE